MHAPTREEANTAGLRSRRLAELASDLPGATAVFRRYRLDFCCGGDATLEEAAQKQGIGTLQIERELRQLDATAPSALSGSPADLIEFIVTRYHDVHRQELPELILLASQVEQRHQDHPDVPAGLAALLKDMLVELQAHMRKEETILFPMMRANPGAFLAPPISRMREEHDAHARLLQHLQKLTHDLVLPAGACSTWRALYAGLHKFTDDFMDHIHTENNVLFPKFER